MNCIAECQLIAQHLEPLLPKFHSRKHSSNDILSAIVWLLRTGSPWSFLPKEFPPKSTCHYWFHKIFKYLNLSHVISDFLLDNRFVNRQSTEECYIDATFIKCRSGGEDIGSTKIGKGNKLVAIVDSNGIPISLFLSSATPHEVTLVEQTIKNRLVPWLPKNLVGDRAYDSDKLDLLLNRIGIEFISPHKSNRKNVTQDGRRLRRYKRRWKVEQFFSHYHNYKRASLRHERKKESYTVFAYLAVLVILIKKILRRKAKVT